MCPECEGIGKVTALDLDAFIDTVEVAQRGRRRSTRTSRSAAGTGSYVRSSELVRHRQAARGLHARTSGSSCSTAHGKMPVEWQGGEINATYEGLVDKFTRLYIKKDLGAMAERNREVFLRYVDAGTCPLCKGARLNQAALAAEIDGYNIAELLAMEASELVSVLSALSDPVPPRRFWRACSTGCGNLVTIGLGYLTPRPGDDDPLRRRVAADQDGAPPEQQPHRHDVHLRRAVGRPARPRRRSGSTSCSSSCATRATRCWSSSTTAT